MKRVEPKNQWVLPSNPDYDLGLTGRNILTGFEGRIVGYRMGLKKPKQYRLANLAGEAHWLDLGVVEVYDSRETWVEPLDGDPELT